MAIAGKWASLKGVILDEEIIEVLTSSFGFPTMTPVQAAAIPPLLSSKDVSVDAETGSGKTLSFLIPIAQSLLFGKDCLSHRKRSKLVRAVIILPTRELAAQVRKVAVQLFSKLPGNIVPCLVIGGQVGPENWKKSELDVTKDQRLIIATPGRLNSEILASSIVCSKLEFLILDEADRLLDMGFDVTLTSILSRLPKQRRTGLYSATQTAGVEELARAGLRNPVRIAVKVALKPSGPLTDSDEQQSVLNSTQRRIPSSLKSYYCLSAQEDKLIALGAVLAQRPCDKFIVYFLTCASVQFHSLLPLDNITRVVQQHMKSPTNTTNVRYNSGGENLTRKFFTLHGKLPQKKRTRNLAGFSSSENGVLLCTDVAARGIDLPDVDCVVQFDPPQDPDVYIHRAGRTARLGREGSSLILLSPSEDTYVEFLTVRQCPVSNIVDFGASFFGNGEAIMMLKSLSSPEDTGMSPAALRSKVAATVRDSIVKDRAVLDASEGAFLSYIRGYKEHKCRYILKLDNLDVGSVARSFGLLRLPRFHEFKKLRAKIDFTKDASVRVRDIAYRDRAREAKRQAQIQEAVSNAQEMSTGRNAKTSRKRKGEARSMRKDAIGKKQRRGPQPSSNASSRNATDEGDSANEDFGFEAWQLRKVRRGKLSRKEFETLTNFDADALPDT